MVFFLEEKKRNYKSLKFKYAKSTSKLNSYKNLTTMESIGLGRRLGRELKFPSFHKVLCSYELSIYTLLPVPG